MFLRITLGAILAAIVIVGAIRLARRPATDRTWVPPQAVLPDVRVNGDLVDIRHVRDFTYRSASDFDVRYVDRRYDLRKLDSVWYVVSRFGGFGAAHAFLSFGFGGDYVCISVEARKEEGETYSPLRGLLNQYELMYVIGTERDVIGVRTHVWQESVGLYPIRTTPERMRSAFLGMVQRAGKLAREPEFYDTIFNSCNSNIVRHVNEVVPRRVGFDVRTLLPGYSDEVAYELGLIDSNLPFERMREAFRIDDAARGVPLDQNFSRAIRRKMPPRGRP